LSGKNQFPITFNWQSSDPAVGFVPVANQAGSAPSGVSAGTMSSTDTIYSQIVDVSKMDNIGLDVSWTGTPTGTLSVTVSNTGLPTFSALTFSPALAQPSGSAGYMTIDLNQLPYKYICLKYVNASGSGSLSITAQNKDLN
jgi:hypothetical protein